jgi:hypothetical protein
MTARHKMPATLFASEELMLWHCAVCGQLVSEFDPQRDDCPGDPADIQTEEPA